MDRQRQGYTEQTITDLSVIDLQRVAAAMVSNTYIATLSNDATHALIRDKQSVLSSDCLTL